jgi:hypothetical protein
VKKSYAIRALELFVISVTILTLSLTSLGYLTGSIVEYFIILEADGIGGLLILELTERLREPTIIIRPVPNLPKVGFSVKVKGRTVNDAKVNCNDVSIDWEDLDGTPHQSIKLQVNASPPAYFFPFRIEVTESGSNQNEQYIIIYLYQNRSKYDSPEKPHPLMLNEAQGQYTIPKGAFATIRGKSPLETHFEASIRITGDEIEEAYNRVFDVYYWPTFSRKKNSDKLEDVEFDIILSMVETRFFRKKRYNYDADYEQMDPEIRRHTLKKRTLREIQNE